MPTTTATAAQDGRLPDGTSVPSEAVEAPASVSAPGEIAPGVPDGSARRIVAGESTHGIPDAALSAYQRAAQVIGTADRGCNLDWTLVAAIGRVESDHGRYGGNTLTGKGVSSPGIYGIPLDGSSGTAKITDTDAGELDDDPVFDRAVGPMQFIPSTWSVVGVDGDGDGVRNPQDIDDAALATAVYLCSGDEDLATDEGRRAAVYRYNHSQEYVDLVLAIMTAYADGEFSRGPQRQRGPGDLHRRPRVRARQDRRSRGTRPRGHGRAPRLRLGQRRQRRFLRLRRHRRGRPGGPRPRHPPRHPPPHRAAAAAARSRAAAAAEAVAAAARRTSRLPSRPSPWSPRCSRPRSTASRTPRPCLCSSASTPTSTAAPPRCRTSWPGSTRRRRARRLPACPAGSADPAAAAQPVGQRRSSRAASAAQ